MAERPPTRRPDGPTAARTGVTTDADEVRARIALLAEQVRQLGPAGTGAAAPPGTATAEVIAAAERVAEEIRASARREAARVAHGQGQGQRSSELASALLGAIARQRQTIGVLAGEIERIEQSAALLRARVRLLENELARIDEFLRRASAPAA